MTKNILAIIPARGGSKGLTDKNILPLAGYPLLAYSIRAALDTPSINRVIVSTDSQRIAEEAIRFGAEIPFIRPAKIAGDFSTDLEVFTHALNWLEKNENYIPDYVVQLRPTSPLRSVKLIEDCIEKLSISDCDSLRIVTKSFHTPYKMWRLADPDHPMTPLLDHPEFEEPFNQPRQNLPDIYWQIGTLDVIRTEVITRQKSMSGRRILPHIVDQEWAVDIDDLASFQKAERLLEKLDCIRFNT